MKNCTKEEVKVEELLENNPVRLYYLAVTLYHFVLYLSPKNAE